MKTYRNRPPFDNLDQFTQSLQKEDERNRKLTRNFQWIMWTLAPLYAVIFMIEPEWKLRIGGLCYAAAFILFALVFRMLNKEYREIDYGQPVKILLQKAAIRYNLFQWKLLKIILPVIILDTGMVLLTLDRFGSKSIWESVIRVQLILLPALLIGFTIGSLIWRKRQKPLRDAARSMLREMEE